MTGHVLACGGGGMHRDERRRLRPGPLLEPGLALSGVDGRSAEAVGDRDGASAWRVDATGERPVPVRRLG